jgi:hypothetical protein
MGRDSVEKRTGPPKKKGRCCVGRRTEGMWTLVDNLAVLLAEGIVIVGKGRSPRSGAWNSW